MPKRIGFWFGIFCLILYLGAPSAALGTGTVSLTSLDWEPYIGQNLKNGGYVAEIVREAFARSGYKVKIAYLPWARTVLMARRGSYDGYFPEYFAEELKTDFLISDPFPGGPLVFYKRKADTLNFKNLEDLKPYRFGIVRGYVNTAEFDAADYLDKDPAVDDLTNLRKLLAKRVNLILIDKYVAEHLLKKHLPTRKEELESMEPPLEIKDLFLCLSRKDPKAQEKLEAFNKGLTQMKADGTIAVILAKHGMK